MVWKTMSIPDLVNLENQHAQTLDESPKKTAKFLNLQLWQMKFSKQNQNLPVSAVTAKSQEIGEGGIVTNVNLTGIFSLLTSLSIVLPIPNDEPLSNSRYFSISLQSAQRNKSLDGE